MQKPLRILLLIIFILVPVVNFGLPRLLIEGDQFADAPSTRVDAAGYAFAIWGVIRQLTKKAVYYPFASPNLASA